MSDRKIFNDTTHGAPRDLCATAELLRKQPIIIFVFFCTYSQCVFVITYHVLVNKELSLLPVP